MPRRLWVWCSVVLLLALFWGRVLVNVRDQSPVVDEPLHMTRAAAYWRAGDLRLQCCHPPLSHALSGALLMLEPKLPSPADLPGWSRASLTDVSRHLLLQPERPIGRASFLARWPMLALGLILSALVGRWAGQLFGHEAGLAALFLCTFAPNILAHSGLATTDITVTCLTCAACYTFHRWLEQPLPGHALLAGSVLGLAWSAKLSALILVPVMGLALVWRIRQRGVSSRHLFVGFGTLLGVALLVTWALYRFELSTWRQTHIPLPMPTYWDSLQDLWQHQSRGHHTFFLGQLSDQGWWYYFPILFLIKTPLPLLILVVIAVVAALGTQSPPWPPVAIIFPAFYLGVSIASRINIGYRHILPVVPFVLILAASIFRPAERRPWWKKPIPIGLVLWVAVSSLQTHPYYLAYFNELVGGPDQGYRYAVDSNLDWGQDLKRLQAHLDEREIDQVKLSYFGTANPEQYGIAFEPLLGPSPSRSPPSFSPLNPEPGVYAISASDLQGLLLEDSDVFDWFRRRRPTAKIGYSIFVYEVGERLEGQWAAVCYAPLPALEPDRIQDALGSPDLRLVYFDCRSSWVHPAGSSPGWYLIPETTDAPTVVPAHVSDSQILFQGRRTSRRRGLTLYRGEGAGSRPDRSRASQEFDHAPRFADMARFLGYEMQPIEPIPGEILTLRTYWEVLNRPNAPLSVMAHLVDNRGTAVGIADGLGFTTENWQKGDVFAQAHRFTLPAESDTTGYAFRVGLYRLDTMERVPPEGVEAGYLVLDLGGDEGHN